MIEDAVTFLFGDDDCTMKEAVQDIAVPKEGARPDLTQALRINRVSSGVIAVSLQSDDGGRYGAMRKDTGDEIPVVGGDDDLDAVPICNSGDDLAEFVRLRRVKVGLGLVDECNRTTPCEERDKKAEGAADPVALLV